MTEQRLGDSTKAKLPEMGFGTWPLLGAAAESAVGSALSIGYRLIDTAMNYDNEAMVGKAVRESGISRDEIVITSKFPLKFHSQRGAIDAVTESVNRLGLTYIDVYLMHWPNPGFGGYRDAWKGLLEARDMGLARIVGVCNFTEPLLNEIAEVSGEFPAVNQIELNPYFPEHGLRAFHESNGITTEAWSPLGTGRDLLSEDVVQRVAAAKGITPAQVVLAWHQAQNVIPLPRSSNLQRRVQNLESVNVRLSKDELHAFDALAGRADYQKIDPMTYAQEA